MLLRSRPLPLKKFFIAERPLYQNLPVVCDDHVLTYLSDIIIIFFFIFLASTVGLRHITCDNIKIVANISPSLVYRRSLVENGKARGSSCNGEE